jgi:hypothetical protein
MHQSPAGNELHLTHLVLLIRRSPRLSSEHSAPGSGKGAQPELDSQSDQVTGQPPPPSLLAASQRPFRIQPSRAKRNLHGAGPRAIGSLSILQTFTAFLQFIGKHTSAAGQDQFVFFETNDRMPTKEWKAVSPALDKNQPTTKFSNWNPNNGENPLADRSSGVGPVRCIDSAESHSLAVARGLSRPGFKGPTGLGRLPVRAFVDR